MCIRRTLMLCAILASPVALSNGGTGAGIAGSVVVKENGVVLVNFAAPHLNPDDCDNDLTVAILSDEPDRNEMLALVTAAVVSGGSVTFWVTGCYSGWGTTYAQVSTTTLIAP